jgi:hypothetical protein
MLANMEGVCNILEVPLTIDISMVSHIVGVFTDGLQKPCSKPQCKSGHVLLFVQVPLLFIWPAGAVAGFWLVSLNRSEQGCHIVNLKLREFGCLFCDILKSIFLRIFLMSWLLDVLVTCMLLLSLKVSDCPIRACTMEVLKQVLRKKRFFYHLVHSF